MDITDILTEYGSYYIKGGQNEKRLKNLLMYGFEFLQYMTPIPTDDTIYRMAEAEIDDVLQGFKTTFSPTGGDKFKPNPIELFQNKIDKEYSPDDISKSWLGFLGSNSLERKDWPLIRWLLEKKIIPKMHENFETAIYSAVYQAPPAGTTPGALLHIMNGIKYQLIQGIGNDLNRITLNPLTTSNIFDEIETFRQSISVVYRRQKMNYFMSTYWAEQYMKGKRDERFVADNGTGYGKVDFSPHTVIGMPGMDGSNVIFATPKDNFIYLTKGKENIGKFKIESYRRLVSIFTDFYQGVGFGTMGGVFAYIPEGEIGSGSGSSS